jgi:di/tricarboxylate transporter
MPLLLDAHAAAESSGLLTPGDGRAQAIVLVVLLASLVLFVTEALRYDVVAVLIVLVLAATGCLSPIDAFSGFSSPAVVLIASMYIFGHAMSRTGVAESIGQRLIVGRAQGEAALAVRVVLVSGLLSSLLSNTGVVAALIPVLGAVARRADVPVSRLLIPLAFGSLLGGMLTVIGTSTNIAVNMAIEQAGGVPFGLFDFSHLGFLFLIAGALYFLSPFRRLLPRARAGETLSEHYQVPQFVAEVMVEPTSTLINRTVRDADLFEQYGVSVLGIARPGEASVLAPGPYNRIRAEDTLILQGVPESLVRLRQDLGLRKRESVEIGQVRLTAADVQLVEAVVPAGSGLAGRTLREADFRPSTGLNVLAISKQGDVQAREINETPLDVGDSLLIQGHAPDIQRLRASRLLVVLGELEVRRFGQGAFTTMACLFAILLVVALGWLDLAVAALAGACALVLLRVVRPEDVRRTIDWTVLLLIGGLLALGAAFTRHQLDSELSHWLAGLGDMASQPRLLLGIVLVTTIALTQVMNHVTSAVIMTPMAMSFAAEVGASDRPFLMAVVVGANLCFLSPVAHQANAMVMGPGDYRSRDFLRAGTPLTIGLAIVAMVLLPLFWPFGID